MASRRRRRANASRAPRRPGRTVGRRAHERDPADVHAEFSFRFVTDVLPRRARILEVGCGGGRLARRLIDARYRVTALDTSADAVAEARARHVPALRGDFVEFDGGPFDAVVFVLSLHHIASLARALTHARNLLAPHGWLVADEMARERVDGATATWFFETLDLLDAAGLLSPATSHGHAGRELRRRSPATHAEAPLARWREPHRFDPSIHTGRAMQSAIAVRFDGVHVAHGPHLFRYPCRRLLEGERGTRVAQQILRAEQRGIDEGRLRAAGIRIVARRRPTRDGARHRGRS
jgi:SAM-dependent methyltransferase